MLSVTLAGCETTILNYSSDSVEIELSSPDCIAHDGNVTVVIETDECGTDTSSTILEARGRMYNHDMYMYDVQLERLCLYHRHGVHYMVVYKWS